MHPAKSMDIFDDGNSRPMDIFDDGKSMETSDVESDEESDDIEDSEDEFDEKAWEDLVKPVLQKHKERFRDKCEDYENNGMSPENAERFASEDMYHTYKADIILQYERLVNIMHQLGKSRHHKKILRDVERFQSRGQTYEKALRLALKRNHDIFYEIIDNVEEDVSESEEEDVVETIEESTSANEID